MISGRKIMLSVLVLLMVFAFTAAVEAEEPELNLWQHEFVIDWQGREAVVEFFEENTELNVSDDYGPSGFDSIEEQFIVQARTGYPDVVEGTPEQMFSYQEAGLLKSLDEFWQDYEDRDQYPDALLEALEIDGELYGLPYSHNVRMLLYRESVFEEHDLEVPENWEELVETAAYISENVEDMQGFIFTSEAQEVRVMQEFLTFYYQLNDDGLFDGESEPAELLATQDQLEEVLTLYYDMYTEGGVDMDERGSDWMRTDYGYTGGDFAMVTVGPWVWGHRADDKAAAEVLDDTVITHPPVHEDGDPATFMEVAPMMINAHTEHPELSWELLKEVTSKDFQLLINTLSGAQAAREDAQEQEAIEQLIAERDDIDEDMAGDWWLAGFSEYADIGVAPAAISWDRVEDYIIDSVQQVIYEQQTPAEAAEELYFNLDELEL